MIRLSNLGGPEDKHIDTRPERSKFAAEDFTQIMQFDMIRNK